MNVHETFDAIVTIANSYHSIGQEHEWIDYPMKRHHDIKRTITLRKEDENRIVYKEETEITPHYYGTTVSTKIVVLAFDGAVRVTTDAGTPTDYEQIDNNNLKEIFEHTALFTSKLDLDRKSAGVFFCEGERNNNNDLQAVRNASGKTSKVSFKRARKERRARVAPKKVDNVFNCDEMTRALEAADARPLAFECSQLRDALEEQ